MIDEIIWDMAYIRSLNDTTKTQTQHYNDLLNERERDLNDNPDDIPPDPLGYLKYENDMTEENFHDKDEEPV